MPELFTHTCIRNGCGTQYQDSDSDPYFCELCLKKKKDIAAQVDAKIAQRPKTVYKSDLQIYDEMRQARGGKFPSIGDMGIKL